MRIKFYLLSLLLIVSIVLIAQPKTFNTITTSTKTVAERYFKNYAQLNGDSMALDIADDVTIDDLTSKLLFNNPRISGKEQAIQNFKREKIIFNVTVPVSRSFFSGNFGVFEGMYCYSMYTPNKEVVSFALPIVITIKVENGKVTEHRDYADYQTYLSQMQREMARIKAKGN